MGWISASDPGMYYFVDNIVDATDTVPAHANPGNPFYDALYPNSANATDFIDIPSRPYDGSTVWQGLVFAASGDLNAHTLNIAWRGIAWGFTDPVAADATVPEPSSLLLFACAGLVFAGRRCARHFRWRR
jgi:hypothetical protein